MHPSHWYRSFLGLLRDSPTLLMVHFAGFEVISAVNEVFQWYHGPISFSIQQYHSFLVLQGFADFPRYIHFSFIAVVLRILYLSAFSISLFFSVGDFLSTVLLPFIFFKNFQYFCHLFQFQMFHVLKFFIEDGTTKSTIIYNFAKCIHKFNFWIDFSRFLFILAFRYFLFFSSFQPFLLHFIENFFKNKSFRNFISSENYFLQNFLEKRIT